MGNKIKNINNGNTFLHKIWWIFPIIIILSAVGYAYILTTNKSTNFNAKNASLTDCLRTERENEIDCWYERYSVLVAQNSDTAKAFEDVKIAYESSGYVKSNCHQISHIIGRAAGKKYSTVSEAYQQGDSFCWSGYYHGVMEAVTAKIGKDAVLSQMNTICSDLKTQSEFSFDHYNCVHGLGHGVMQLKDNELFTALEVCDGIDGNWQQESCQGGVFMENVMNEINPGHTSKYLKNDEPLYPCTAVENRFKQQCYLMQTSHALVVVNQDYDKVFELCSSVESPYDNICFQSLGRDASGGSSSSKEITKSLCEKGKTINAIENCYIGAVKDFLSYYHDDEQGLQLCSSIENPAISATCKETAINYYRSF